MESPSNPTSIARRIRVTGIVQGVGCRPFVWQLARELGLSGWIRNDAHGVDIFAQGEATRVATLIELLRTGSPALARVDGVQASATQPDPSNRQFDIVESVSGTATTGIGPDVAVCNDCLADLFDRAGRRWRHSFITCTNCGPRYTVTRALPYDRPQTSLAPFALCADCAREYSSPHDRRFHAQTTCCPNCGPKLSLRMAGHPLPEPDPISLAVTLLRSGAIVAIKGLGGFHLACDARNSAAVAKLRERKNREEKPFAVMTLNVTSLEPYALASPQEQALLESRERPVVLLRSHPRGTKSLSGVAPGLRELGVMLPTTPIHFLLFHEAAGRPDGTAWLAAPHELIMVMTSANPGGEPIVRETAEAVARLAGIADAILDHDRDVAARCDDSVVRASAGVLQFIRRSRGYTPAVIRMPRSGPPVLAFGAHLKNSICATRNDEIHTSVHIGDLENAATCSFLDETVQRMLALLELRPEIVAHDLHPDDYSTQAAVAFANSRGLPLVAVQHHHAHIAAVCAEHRHTGPVIGLALDGFGLGSDGRAWGGELLTVDGARFQRLSHLGTLPMPGGDKAAREPWRMAASALHQLGRNAQIGGRLMQAGAGTIAAMLERDFNCPRSSSMGRIFDAASALLGLCLHTTYEAQAAIVLEQTASPYIERHGWPQPFPDGWQIGPEGELDLLPLLDALLDSTNVAQAAARFHSSLVDGLSHWVCEAAQNHSLSTIAWGGGCFLNSLLSYGLRQNLERLGLTVLAPRYLSPGDASIAVGQAWVAINSLES